MLSIAALALAAASPATSPDILSTAPWWEKITITYGDDGSQRSCHYETSRPFAGTEACDESPQVSAAKATTGSAGVQTKITFERRFTPGAMPASKSLEPGDTFEIEEGPFGLPLRNPVRVEDNATAREWFGGDRFGVDEGGAGAQARLHDLADHPPERDREPELPEGDRRERHCPDDAERRAERADLVAELELLHAFAQRRFSSLSSRVRCSAVLSVSPP